jgi:uncharacterized protein with beta-barrel porin domain
VLKYSWRHLARLAGAIVFALAGVPAQAQWNLYGNGGTFFVPITLVSNQPPVGKGGPPTMTVPLTLNGFSQSKPFILDTGSLGLVASLPGYNNQGQFEPGYYIPGNDQVLAPYATITYSTSGSNPVGSLYLTTLQINGSNGQYMTARVPVLGANNVGFHQLGIGFDRGGISIGQSATSTLTPANNSYQMNPFLALNGGSSGAPNASTMQPGYIIGINGFQSLGLGTNPGVLLGLNSQNTSGYSFQQLASNGGLPSYCSTPGMNCPLQWSAQNGAISITVGTQTYNLGSASQLPDSGISYMIVNAPGNTVPVGPAIPPAVACSDQQTPPSNCLQPGGIVSVYLPNQPQPAYTFTLGDGTSTVAPFAVQVSQGQPPSNLGRTFFENLNYLYDPINGFVGYQANGTVGAVVIPMLALQGTLALPNGFASSFPTFLMSNLTVQQTGSGALGGAITGPGGLTLQSGNLTLGGAASYGGGTVVNGGMLTLGSSGSLLGNVTVNGGGFTNNGSINGNGLLTVNAGGSFVNNGTVNTPNQWQLNQGTFTNNGTFNGSLANIGTASNTGTIAASVINGTAGTFSNTGTITGSVANMGSFANNGSIGGSFANMGTLSGTGTIVGSLINSGVVAPGNSVGTMAVSGNLVSSGVYSAEVVGSGQSDRINVGGAATLGGTVLVTALPGMAFAPSTTYTILNAAGGLNGTTFASVNELYPFLQSSLSYDTNNVYLNLQVGGFAAQALNNTQYAVGAVLDANAPTATGDFATVLGTLAIATAQQGQAFMTAISGNNYAGFSTSMVQGMQLFMNNFANQSGGGGSPMSNRVALAEACDVACDTTSPPKWGAWGGALGGLGTVGAGQPVGTVTYNAGGFAAGLDRLVTDNFRMGVTAGYSTGTQWVGGFDGLGRSNTFQVGLYGGFAQDKVYADGLIGYAYTQNQMWRNIPIPGLQPRTAYGNTGANQWYGQLETGYRFDIGTNANAFVTPFARLQAYTANQNAFTETGAQSLNLSIAQQQTNSLRSVLGAQLGGSMDLGWREKLFAQLRLGWSHEYADVGRPVTATLAGAPAMPFTTWGVSPQRDGVVIGLSANTAIAEATSIYLRYEGDISGQDSAHAITAGVRMTW